MSTSIVRPLIAALVAFGLLICAGPAAAYTVHGKFGIGWEETLTSLGDGPRFASYGDGSKAESPAIRASGMSFHTYYRQWGFEAIVGAEGANISKQDFRWGGFLSLGTHYNLFRAPRVNLSTGVRLAVGMYRGVDDKGASKPVLYGYTFEAPLRAVFFLSDHFAFSAAVGPMVAIAGGPGNPLTGAPEGAVEFALFRGGFSGGVGFVVFFR